MNIKHVIERAAQCHCLVFGEPLRREIARDGQEMAKYNNLLNDLFPAMLIEYVTQATEDGA